MITERTLVRVRNAAAALTLLVGAGYVIRAQSQKRARLEIIARRAFQHLIVRRDLDALASFHCQWNENPRVSLHVAFCREGDLEFEIAYNASSRWMFVWCRPRAWRPRVYISDDEFQSQMAGPRR